MIKIPFFCFYWNFYRGDYAKALANYEPGLLFLEHFRHYSLYRLGMYKTMANLPPLRNKWHSLLAYFVSHAVLGDLFEIKLDINDEAIKNKLKHRRKELALAFLSNSPQISLDLIEKKSFEDVRAAALFHLGKFEEVDSEIYINEPEVGLFYSNNFSISSEEKLSYLNNLLFKNNLSALELRDIGKPLSALNLISKNTGEYFDGPLVTIIMTSFRSRNRIIFSIDSILNQTYKNIELIIVDDASDDGTQDLLIEKSKTDKRIKIILLKRNIGTYAAKTIGLRIARSEFITCNDSDDYAHPQKIEIQMIPLLKDNSIIYTTSSLLRLRDDGFFYAKSIYPLIRLNSSSVLFRKSVVASETGFWDLVRTGADSEFLARLRIVFGKKRHCKINKPLSICAHRPNSLMTSPETGGSEAGMSSMRIDYWESFTQWHIETLRSGKIPIMSNDSSEKRKFYCPPDNMTSLEDFFFCKKELGLI